MSGLISETFYNLGPVIPKKIFSIEKNRYLTLREIFSSKVHTFEKKEEFDFNRLKVVSNSENEIKDFSIEVLSRFNKTWQDSSDDIKLQNKFWSICKEYLNKTGEIETAIGTSFLRKNQYLLQ